MRRGWDGGSQGSPQFAVIGAAWTRSDRVAGVVLAAILVPQGMAYADLAGLPPVPASTQRSPALWVTPSSARHGYWC